MTRAFLALALALAWTQAAQAEGMPQLDFKNPLLLAQVVWGAIIFVLFYLLLSRYFLPPVGEILASRARAIGADLERARLAKQDADQTAQELRIARARALAEAQAEIADATRRAKEEAARRAAEMNAALEKRLAESESAIDAARQSAMRALGSVATETADAVVARLAGRRAGDGKVRQAVSAVLTERGLAGA